MNLLSKHSNKGFTIVELLIVVVVIAILAAITIVSYNSITAQAKESALKSDLSTAAKKINLEKISNGSFPGIYAATGLTYSGGGNSFCITGSANGKNFRIKETGNIEEGSCPLPVATTMQAFTSAHCSALTIYTGSNPAAIVNLTDSRGGTTRTYEVAKLADSKCWMLTNLKLGSTTGTITLEPADSNVASNFTLPQVTAGGSSSYDTPTAHGPVLGDTGSGATNYGYLYNWSAATAGESRATMPVNSGNAPYSICPANWRLPTSGLNNDESATVGDLPDLDRSFGGTGQFAWIGEPNATMWQANGPFKGIFSGRWRNGSFNGQGGFSLTWSSSAGLYLADSANLVRVDDSSVSPSSDAGRYLGSAVRCLLN